MLRVSLLLSVIHAISGQNPTRWGSSVVLTAIGPSPLLRYESRMIPIIYLDGEIMEIEDGICYVSNKEVGKPCSFNETSRDVITEIQLSSVAGHRTLFLQSERWHTTFFAPRCIFPNPGPDGVILKPTLPLARFMKNSKQVTITFAASFDQKDNLRFIIRDDILLCSWIGLTHVNGDPEFCQLKLWNNGQEVRFVGTFHKDTQERNSYEWQIQGKSRVVVSVDWTQTGKAPEDETCSTTQLIFQFLNYIVKKVRDAKELH
uniref:DUF5727 domain-containing protein n=1 Tax=Schistocephalus solidus TaxID=70667 RepID=A0A0X3NP02_SCHSO